MHIHVPRLDYISTTYDKIYLFFLHDIILEQPSRSLDWPLDGIYMLAMGEDVVHTDTSIYALRSE